MFFSATRASGQNLTSSAKKKTKYKEFSTFFRKFRSRQGNCCDPMKVVIHGPKTLKKNGVKVLFMKYVTFVTSCLLTLARTKEFLLFNTIQE